MRLMTRLCTLLLIPVAMLATACTIEEVPADDDDRAPETIAEPDGEKPEVVSGLNAYLDWVDWVSPFEQARARAEAEHRLLMIKPVAFGTGETCW